MIRFVVLMLLGHAALADAAAVASGRNWRIAVECDAPLVIRMRVQFLGRSGVVEAPVSRLVDDRNMRYLPKSVTWKEGGKALAQWLSAGGLRNIDAGALGEIELKFDAPIGDGVLRLEFGDIAAFAVTGKNACLKPGEMRPPRVASRAKGEKRDFRVYRAGYPCGADRRTTEADHPPYLPKQLLLFGRGYLPGAREVDLPMGPAPAQTYAYAGEDSLAAVEHAARHALLADFPQYAGGKYFVFNWGSQKGASGNELYSIGVYELRPCSPMSGPNFAPCGAMNVDKLRESALTLYAAARKEHEYEVAYHALSAALHAAESLEDAACCTLVERLATETGGEVDGGDPAHRVSSQSAAARGHDSIFKQLAIMAYSARVRIEADAVTRKHKGRPQAPL